jgi:hypothetical protein
MELRLGAQPLARSDYHDPIIGRVELLAYYTPTNADLTRPEEVNRRLMLTVDYLLLRGVQRSCEDCPIVGNSCSVNSSNLNWGS